MSANGARHFLDLTEISKAELRAMIETSRAMKAELKRKGHSERPLAGRTLAMIFDRPSTRTRVSFDVAMRQLGGESITLTRDDMQLGRGESIADTARVLSRYIDGIMIRTGEHETLLELAEHATVPVINGLTRRSHPCQVLADVMTFEEHRGPIRGRTIAWSGDGNNVLASWMHAAERFDFRLRVATPPELKPKKWLTDWLKASRAEIVVSTDPEEAVKPPRQPFTITGARWARFPGTRRRLWPCPVWRAQSRGRRPSRPWRRSCGTWSRTDPPSSARRGLAAASNPQQGPRAPGSRPDDSCGTPPGDH